jgi:hypothetical protein
MKASDKMLGELHGHLAKAMLSTLSANDRAATILETYDDLPDEVREFLEDLSNTNPAFLTAVSKFLKDNQITCSIEDSKELSELEQTLQNKRKRVGNVIPIQEE